MDLAGLVERINLGLAIVTPTKFILETIDPDMKKAEKLIEEWNRQMDARRKERSAKMDSTPRDARPDPNTAAKSAIDELARRTEKKE